MSTDPTAPAPKTRTDVLEKYTLSEPPFLSCAELENELDEKLTARLIAAAKLVDPVNGPALAISGAATVLMSRPNAYLSEAFNVGVFREEMVYSIVLACLKRHHPEMSRERVFQLVTDQNRGTLQRACLELMGYALKATANPTTGAAAENPQTPPTTPPSSEISAPPA